MKLTDFPQSLTTASADDLMYVVDVSENPVEGGSSKKMTLAQLSAHLSSLNGFIPLSKYIYGNDTIWKLIWSHLSNNGIFNLKFIGDSTFVDFNGIPTRLANYIAANFPTAFVTRHVINAGSTGLDQVVVNNPNPINRRGWRFNAAGGGKFMYPVFPVSPHGKPALRFEACVSFSALGLVAGKPAGSFLLGGFNDSTVPSIFAINVDGSLGVAWREMGGTFATNFNSSVPVAGGSIQPETFYCLACDIIASSSGSREVRYYTSSSPSIEVARKLNNWVQLGTTVLGAASSFEVIANNSYYIFAGGDTKTCNGLRIHEAQILVADTNNGVRYPVIPNRIDQFSKVSGDGANHQLDGGPVVNIDNLGRNGANFIPSTNMEAAYFNQTGSLFNTNLASIVLDRQDLAVFYTDGHNARMTTRGELKSGMDQIRATVNGRIAIDPVWVNITQNPEVSTSYINEYMCQVQNLHMEYAMQNGIPGINLHRLAYDLAGSRNIDAYTDGGVHPSAAHYAQLFDQFIIALKSGTAY